MRRFFLLIIILYSRSALPQGSPGPIPQQGNYPLGLGVNSVMQQQTWLQQGTTLSQQVNAVTQDALQLQPTILPPLPSGSGPNQYTSSGTVFVSPSPGPTSSSSSTSSGGSSSSGFPGNDGDLVLWRVQYPQNITTIVSGGGISYLDTECGEEAEGMNFPNWMSAKAIIERSTLARCHNTFDDDLLPNTKIYTVNRVGNSNLFTIVTNNSFHQMFDASPPADIGLIKVAHSGGPLQDYTWTGCAENRTQPSPHGLGNCTGWTTGDPLQYATFSSNHNGANWERQPGPIEGGGRCDNPSNLTFRWYCGISWNGGGGSSTSTSTSSSSSSSSGGIQNGDHLVWHSSSTTLTNIVNGGGQPFVNQQCRDEASQMGWPGSMGAKALVNADGAGCKRGLMGGTNNWTTTPTPGQFEVIKSGSINNLFSSGGPSPGPRNKNGNFGGFERITGCQDDGSPSPNNCANFTTLSGASSFSRGFGSGGTWLNNGVTSCDDTLVRPFYCALRWTSSSSSTSSTSSTSSSSGFPGGPNDHIVWAHGSANGIQGIMGIGYAGMNQQCVLAAQQSGWPNFMNARAIVSYGGLGCINHFTGGSNVYQPHLDTVSNPHVFSFQVVYPGPIENMFANEPSWPINRGVGGLHHGHPRVTGCDQNGLKVVNCQDWSSTSPSNQWIEGHVLGNPDEWMYNAVYNCDQPSAIQLGWYCGMKWGP